MSIDIRPATLDELPGIVELLRNANEAPYDLAAVAREKCFGQGLAGPPQTLVATLDGKLAGIAVSCGNSLRILAVHRSKRREGIGSILLVETEKAIQASGGLAVNVAAESGNYFIPGIPAGNEGLRRFFHLHGYKVLPEEPVNLGVELASNPLIVAPTGKPRVQRVSSSEREPLLSFIEAKFARAWRLETERAFQHAEPTLFFSEQDGKIVGFAAHDANNRGLGFFGPAGVLPESQGKGIGRQLLLASLVDLRGMGFQKTTIAWAAAEDFYRRACGAQLAHRFVRLRKVLES